MRKLREAGYLLAEGAVGATVAKHLEVTEQPFHVWQHQFGGVKVDDAKELNVLRRESERVRRTVAVELF